MNPFSYSKVADPNAAIEQITGTAAAKFIGGGTNLVDLMRENIEKPDHLVDLKALNLKTITVSADGSLMIGALVTNSSAAYDEQVNKTHPLLADAILAGASPQLRNMATCGGNLLQRTRCYYFYDKATKCNKREQGSGCDALQGYNRIHAILGQSDACIAVHPSDMCVALAALGTKVHVVGVTGKRQIEFADFHLLPGSTPQLETSLQPGELITGLEIQPSKFTRTRAYLKVRDRASYAFALVSAAVGLELNSSNTIQSVGVAMGGLAHKPWRDQGAEKMLIGQKATRENFVNFAEIFFKDAKGYEHNSFKLRLGPKVLVRALEEAAEKVSV